MRNKGERRTAWRGRLATWLRPVAMALVLAASWSWATGWVATPGGSTARALACGLGNTPTMLANQAPALFYPVTHNVPDDQPVGLFALTYNQGRPIAFDEDLSRVPNAPDPNRLQWRWQFGDGSTVPGSAPTHTYAHAGIFNVHVQIYDTSSATWNDLDSAQITVVAAALPHPPIAHATASAEVVPIGGTVTFDAAGSRAEEGSALTYLWNFNDGSTATGAHVTHQFTIAGWGFVALIVTDARGARAVATTDIVVGDNGQTPQVQLTANARSVSVGHSLSFAIASVAGASGNASGQIAQYSWNFGDGSPNVVTTHPTVSHRYLKTGTFTVTAQLEDQHGRQGIARVVITVDDPGARRTVALWVMGAGLLALAGLLGWYYVYPAALARARSWRRGTSQSR